MNQPVMSTKADTLSALQSIVNKSHIEDMMIITVRDFLRGKRAIFHIIAERFKGDFVVIRSSSTFEDSIENSKAGHYESVLNVDSYNVEAVTDAITKVMLSYTDGDDSEERLQEVIDEQILIQRQTRDVIMSGVVFTRDIIYNRPYYMISYDNDGKTDTVTGGKGGKTRWIAKNVSREFLEERFLKLIMAVREIEALFLDIEALDIEFAINKDDEVIIFQVRPLAAVINQPHILADRDLRDAKSLAKCAYLDESHMLSDAAYWNLSRTLGVNPRPLDCSLYRELITSRAWSEGVSVLGYMPVEEDMMQKIGNKPYISMDYAFQGLTPKGLDKHLCYKLFSYYKDQLHTQKGGHRKLESEVVFHSYDFMTERRLEELGKYNFSEEEINQIRQVLFHTTSKLLKNYKSITAEDKRNFDILADFRHEVRANSPLLDTNVMKLYKYIEELLDSLHNNGAAQYARQAGYAYVARNLCQSLVVGGYFSKEQITRFYHSIPTIRTQFDYDYDCYTHGMITKTDFDAVYGHIRTATYDIRTDCFKNMLIDIDDITDATAKLNTEETYMLDRDILEKAISDIKIDISADELLEFLVLTTQNRAYFDFEFTKSLSLILEIVIRLGEILGIAREDMSYLEVPELLSYHSRDSYIQIIEQRRDMYHLNTYLVLPDTIYGIRDIDVIDIDETKPNFITNKYVTADVVNFDIKVEEDIAGKIILMSEANPRYDWIFKKGIAGLITEFGGATSHMALCCAEFGTPAAIGCGASVYGELTNRKRITLDCSNAKIR